MKCIDNLQFSPYIGRHIPNVKDKHFRQLIYRKLRTSYVILYYVSEVSDTIHIIYIANGKQDLNGFLKIHNYFNNYFNF